MYRKQAFQFAALAIVNIWVCFCVRIATRQFMCHWDGMLGGEALPIMTVFAFRTWAVWPTAALLASIVGAAMAYRGRISESVLSHSFAVIVILELLALSFHMLGLIAPSFTITYTLSP